MTLRNISIVLMLVLSSGSVLATDFKVYNRSSIKNVGYALIHGGIGSSKWAWVGQGNWKYASSGLSQLLGIWIEYWTSNERGGVAYYYVDVSGLKIPVVRVGVSIDIGDNGELVVAGKPVKAQQMEKPKFVQ